MDKNKSIQTKNKLTVEQGSRDIISLQDVEYLDIRLYQLGVEGNIRAGSIYINKEGEIYKVVKIEVLEPTIDWDATRKYYNGHEFQTKPEHGKSIVNTAYDAGELTDDDMLWIKSVNVWFSWLKYDDPELWLDDSKPKEVTDFFDDEWMRLEKPLAQYQAEAMGLREEGIDGTDKYWDESVNFSSETALIGKVNKEVLEGVKSELEDKGKHVAIVTASMTRKFMLMERELTDRINKEKELIEKKKSEIQVVMDEMYEIVADFEKKIKKMNEVIAVIELYLGVHEEVVQIQGGNAASSKEIIYLFQMLLYMDEEVGDPREISEEVPGIHSGNIEEFDSWLCDPRNDGIEGKNYERLISTDRGVVALQISRQIRDYYGRHDGGQASFWVSLMNSARNAKDRATYILIRNGENIYRVCSNIDFQPRMFPHRSEMQEYYDEIRKKVERETKKLDGEWVKLNDYEKEDKVSEEMYDKQFPYMKKSLLLQGLLDRTDIFKPMPVEFKFMEPETHEGVLQFVQDDEYVLPDGKLSFSDFKEQSNDRIERGSRVILIDGFDDVGPRLDDRFNTYGDNGHNLPKPPNTGMYIVYSKWVDMRDIVYVYKKDWEDYYGNYSRGEVVVRNSYSGKKQHTHEVWICKDQAVIDSAKKQIYNNINKGIRGQKDHVVEWVDKSYQLYDDNTNRTYYTSKTIYTKQLVLKYKKEQLFIKYNPKDEVRNNWDWRDAGHERKNRLSFKIYRDDKYVLNYDQMSLDDIEYYINNRYERKDYMWVIKHLWELKDTRKKELVEERKFVQHAIIDHLSIGFHDAHLRRLHMQVWDAVSWWKTKVIWKRPLTEDVSKAVRMITSRVDKWRIPYGKRNGLI